MAVVIPLVGRVAAHRGPALAVVDGEVRWSWDDLHARVACARGGLLRSGVGPGDVVAIPAVGCGFVAVYLACHGIGAIALPVSPKRAVPVDAFVADPACLLDGPPAPARPVELDAVADLLLTSGTTGSARPIPLTHRNIAAQIRQITAFFGDTPGVEAIALPLDHSFGLGRLRTRLALGGTVRLCRGFVPFGPLLDALDGATAFAVVPAALPLLRRLAPRLPRLDHIEVGSAPMGPDARRELLGLFPGARIGMHYGLTQASRACFVAFDEDLETAGRPSDGVEVAIRDGEIHLRGANVIQYTWTDDGPVPRDDAWLRTGDLGRLDDGVLTVLGRRDDAIDVGGVLVHPASVEALLRRHPAVADARCRAVPDPAGMAAKRLAVDLVVDGTPPTLADVAAFLAPHVPRAAVPVAVRTVSSLPRTATE